MKDDSLFLKAERVREAGVLGNISRRTFLKRMGQGGALLVASAALPSCGSSEGTFYFGVISDTHVVADTNARQNRMLAYTVEVLNAYEPALDFVVVTGDMVNILPSDDPSYYEQHHDTALDQFTDLVAPLNMPLYPVMGNHDYYTGEILIPAPTKKKEAREQLYIQRLGLPSAYYAIEHKGVKLYFLNTMQQDPGIALTPNTVGTTGPDQIEWLMSELGDRKPTFFFQHHAIATDLSTHAGVSSLIPFELPRADGNFPKYRLSPWRDYTDYVYPVLEAAGDQLRACFCGHSHAFLRDQYAGVPFYLTDSMHTSNQNTHYDGNPMRYHIVACQAGTGSYSIQNEYMIHYMHGGKDQAMAEGALGEVISSVA